MWPTKSGIPLNAICTAARNPCECGLSEDAPEAESEVDLVSNEVQRLDRVVLRTAKPESADGTGSHRIRSGGTWDVSVIETIATRGNSGKRRAGTGENLVDFKVHADRGLIEQGLLNIVNNAIQAFCRSGGRAGELKVSVMNSRGELRDRSDR